MKFDWKKWLVPDWRDMLFLLIVLWLLFWYQHDTAKCDMVVDDPVGWCESSGACDVLWEQREVLPFGNYNQGESEKGFG